MLSPSHICGRAQGLLAQAGYARALLSAPQLLAERDRSYVLRCSLELAGAAASTVVIKQMKPASDLLRSCTDLAGISFLSTIAETRGIAPRYLAGDGEQRLLIMEDLGPGHTLEALLQTPGEPSIGAALIELGRRMAQLHTGTAGHEPHWSQLTAQHTPPPASVRRQEAARWLSGCRRLRQWFASLGYRPPRELGRCLRRVSEQYVSPGAWLAFSHGDPAPSNAFIGADRVCLLDFEYAGFRHALYDITGWEILCPLPPSLLQPMVESFRAELSRTVALAVDETSFQKAWASLCTFRALALLSWLPCSILAEDRPFVGEWSARRAAVAALTRLQRVSFGRAELAPVEQLAGHLLERMHAAWPEIERGPTPPWPALVRTPA